jgi:hypothetical protein
MSEVKLSRAMRLASDFAASRHAGCLGGGSGANQRNEFDISTRFAANRQANVKFKTPLENLMVSGGPSILTFARMPAAPDAKCQNWTTRACSLLTESEAGTPYF